MYKFCFIFLFFVSCIVLGEDGLFDSVEHKNMQLGLYLDAIQYNAHEKIGILPYLLKKQEGIFLEIGTGGDPIAEIFKNIPTGFDITIIASDVDKFVLDSLLVRHPELYPYVNNSSGPKLELKQLNAVDMGNFSNQYLDGINASSVVHEIISYAGGLQGCDSFFKEACRVLKSNGILVYRDPEFVADKYEMILTSLQTKSLKLFAHVFLYKFLDKRGSALAKIDKKFCLYNFNEIAFVIYKKNEIAPIRLSFQEYLELQSYDIDFARDYKIEMPAGLHRELLRHYLTYLHQCNPLVFVKMVPNLINQNYTVSYYAHSTSLILKAFLKKNNFELNDCTIFLHQKHLIEAEIEKRHQVLEFGIPLQFSDKKQEIKLRSLLHAFGLNPSIYMIAVDHKKYLLDYRIFGLLFDQIQALFDVKNKPIDQDDIDHALWLKREGEESYCYYSVDELIARVLSITYYQSGLDGMVLFPMQNCNLFVERWCYTELLKDSCSVQDMQGFKQTLFDGKRIIHFQKVSIQEALKSGQLLIKENPCKYPMLEQILDEIEKDVACKKSC